jgi:hypothetical protein
MRESILFMVFFLAKDGALILGITGFIGQAAKACKVLIRQWQIALTLIGYAQGHAGLEPIASHQRLLLRLLGENQYPVSQVISGGEDAEEKISPTYTH